jgi:AcrR family transcriptional regulator
LSIDTDMRNAEGKGFSAERRGGRWVVNLASAPFLGAHVATQARLGRTAVEGAALARERPMTYLVNVTDIGNTMATRGRPRSFDRHGALARAMEVFWAKGYDGASMADLTLAMGIASPSLYAAFGSKEELFREAIELYNTSEGSEIWSELANAATAFQAVEGFLMQSARVFTRSDKPRGCLVVLSALHATETSATVRRELIAMRQKNVADLAARLKRAAAAGEISREADVNAIAGYYVTVQQGMSIQARDGGSRHLLESIARAALAAWQPLVSARAPEKRRRART